MEERGRGRRSAASDAGEAGGVQAEAQQASHPATSSAAGISGGVQAEAQQALQPATSSAAGTTGDVSKDAAICREGNSHALIMAMHGQRKQSHLATINAKCMVSESKHILLCMVNESKQLTATCTAATLMPAARSQCSSVLDKVRLQTAATRARHLQKA